jgi:hypothetical protein
MGKDQKPINPECNLQLSGTIFLLSCVRMRQGRAAAIALPRRSLSLPRTFIGLVYSKFELMKIKLKK